MPGPRVGVDHTEGLVLEPQGQDELQQEGCLNTSAKLSAWKAWR